jgi:hypothetical protein
VSLRRVGRIVRRRGKIVAHIVEVDEKGELSIPRELLPDATPHRRYVLEVNGSTIMLKLEDGKLPFWATATPEERAERFRQWVQSHPPSPILPDEAFDRESIYD